MRPLSKIIDHQNRIRPPTAGGGKIGIAFVMIYYQQTATRAPARIHRLRFVLPRGQFEDFIEPGRQACRHGGIVGRRSPGTAPSHAAQLLGKRRASHDVAPANF